ncbi:MAG: hypothetical protein RLN88_04400 [Ekhidna sp.]|uniref:hypothetical protein n=1 Tax=Ekhidna sp. TaxID=2608089 RepID=UPI0032ED0290
MKNLLLISLLIASQFTQAQNESIKAFENLVGSTWIADGKQLGGHDGKTVKEFEWGLERKIVKVKTYTTDPKTLEFGLRNEGVRAFNSETKQLEFYEFDKLGGVSKGIIKIEGKNIYYEYAYGDMLLRDSWIFLSEDEYRYQVCSMKDETCDQTFHEGGFKRKK